MTQTKIVPIEPTPAMLVALWEHREKMLGQSENRIAREGYKAMLKAAPSVESEPVGGIFYLPDSKYPKATFNTLDLPEGTLLYTHPDPRIAELNYKRAVFESLIIAIQHAKVASNPFEFLCNQIWSMDRTEFTKPTASKIAELEAKYNELDIRCTGYYHDIETMAIKRAELEAKLKVAREALQSIVKHFDLMGKSITDNSTTYYIATKALKKIGDYQ